MEDKELTERFQAERDKLFNRINEEREAFAKNWLMAMGWDGKDREQARQLADGWVLQEEIGDKAITFRMVRKEELEKDGK